MLSKGLFESCNTIEKSICLCAGRMVVVLEVWFVGGMVLGYEVGNCGEKVEFGLFEGRRCFGRG